jgi:Type II transport protein GspH
MGAPAARGAALIDVVFTAGLVAVLSGIAIPLWHAARQHHEARAGIRYVAARLQHARVEAIRRNVTVALRIDRNTLDRVGLYADGDGDGVLQTDIDRGIDLPIAPEERWSDHLGTFALRINQNVEEADTGAALAAGSNPLRLGNTALVSFSPLGSTSSGTLYFAAPIGPQLAVRLLGATGRLRVLRFDAAGRQWRDE